MHTICICHIYFKNFLKSYTEKYTRKKTKQKEGGERERERLYLPRLLESNVIHTSQSLLLGKDDT